MNPNINNLMNPNINNMMLNQNIMNNMEQNKKDLILNIINQNIQLTNQIAINNNMIKEIIDNPNFNMENINKKNDFYNELYNMDFFPGKYGERINIIFEGDLIKINVVAPLNVTIEELIEIFYIKFQIEAKYRKINIFQLNNYNFLYKGCVVPTNEKKTLKEYGLNSRVEHILFNLKNILIGGLNLLN